MASSLFGNQPVMPNQMPGISNLKSMIQMFKAASNPQAFVQQMMANSPNEAAQIMSLIRQNGNDPKAAFYYLAKQKGIDPDEFLQQLQ